jgi:hypothetical protein
MLVYLDMCCLKRPFDDQSRPRIRLEAEAVLTVLARESAELRFVRSTALLLENAFNPLPERSARVGHWLRSGATWQPTDVAKLEARVAEWIGLGLRNFDALHVSIAEQAGADRFVTVDDRLLAALRRHGAHCRVPVRSVLELAQEVST